MIYSARFRRASQVAVFGGALHVFLAALKERERAPKPWLFRGELAHPLLFRDCLLTLHEVVGARFFRPDLWRYLDPVVTVEPDCVRLECFTSDSGVYARADLDPQIFHEGELGSCGTTNVDFGNEFAASLAGLRPSRKSVFEVGEESVTLQSGLETTIERKVKLPEHWVRGFIQLQAIQRSTRPYFELPRTQARRLLQSLPVRQNVGEARYVTPQGTALISRPDGPCLEVEGLHRLRLLRRLAPQVENLYVWSHGDRGPSFWVADLGCARVTFGLSSAINHTFPGDGEALRRPDRQTEPEMVERARSLVNAGRLDVTRLASSLQTTEALAAQLLDQLGEQGLIGFDLAREAFYPRHLPYVRVEGFTIQPREVNARRLVAESEIELEAHTSIPEGLELVGWVKGDQGEYRVKAIVGRDGTLVGGDCTCAWVLKHGLRRGPCKHILALRSTGDVDE